MFLSAVGHDEITHPRAIGKVQEQRQEAGAGSANAGRQGRQAGAGRSWYLLRKACWEKEGKEEKGKNMAREIDLVEGVD